MNEYRITYELDGETGRAKITERSEAAARKDFKAHIKNATITDVELTAENVPATKDQERDALATIEKLVEELGRDSYVATAFSGCFAIAEMNIDCDAADSLQERIEHLDKIRVEAQRKCVEVERENAQLKKQMDELREQLEELKAKTIPEQLRKSLYVFVSDEEVRARGSMEIAAENMATMADAPQDIAFARSVESYRKAKERRDRCAEMVSGLDALEPKTREGGAT